MTKEEFRIQKEVAFWGGRLMGHPKQWEIAKEIVATIEYAKKTERVDCWDCKVDVIKFNGELTTCECCGSEN